MPLYESFCPRNAIAVTTLSFGEDGSAAARGGAEELWRPPAGGRDAQIHLRTSPASILNDVQIHLRTATESASTSTVSLRHSRSSSGRERERREGPLTVVEGEKSPGAGARGRQRWRRRKLEGEDDRGAPSEDVRGGAATVSILLIAADDGRRGGRGVVEVEGRKRSGRR
uniref:Uncharacterized protein n=1 Tax=Oryza sativa subsp. japonica TaxID=39947 RepID=Q6Z525_ORYSJ|nr:hypothetical protein [Oryza sativa Japonica Group]BAD10158.1 hypothetical protein [Oryza sativa Japonica Group]